MNDVITNEFKRDLESIVKKALGQKATLVSIEPWNGGLFNKCYNVGTKNPTQNFFLKIECETIFPGNRRGQIEKEVNGLKLLSGAGVPCPQVIHYDYDKKDMGKRYILTDLIPGDLLLLKWNDLLETEIKKVQDEIEDILKKISTIKSTRFGDFQDGGLTGKHSSWQELCRGNAEQLLADSIQLNIFTSEELQVVKEALVYEYTKNSGKYTPVFVHGDLGVHNVIYGSNFEGQYRITIIDCGNSMFGLPYTDEIEIRRRGEFGLEKRNVLEERGIDTSEYNTEISNGLGGVVFRTFMKVTTEYSHCPPPIKDGVERMKTDSSRSYIEEFVQKCRDYRRWGGKCN